MVHFSQTKNASITLILAASSLLCCAVVAFSIRLDPRASKSYHLILVQNLMRSNIGLGLCIVTYFSVQYHMTGNNLEVFCSSFLPFLVYFFLLSSAWTVMLALRFRTSQNVAAQFNRPPLPMWAVWLLPAVPAIAMLVVGVIRSDVTDARTQSEDTNQSCQFDYTSEAGIATDLICFQIPLIAMMLMNIYTYVRGLLALHNAPHSVVARQMSRAGGYLGVLLFVWVPNIVYNLLAICDDTNEPYDNFLSFTVMLSASQGLLNTCVYVYSNRAMMRWLKTNLCFLRLTGLAPRPSNLTSTDHKAGEGGNGNGVTVGVGGAEPSPGPSSTTESEVDDLDDDSEWFRSAPSMSAAKGLRRTAQGHGQGASETSGDDEESGDVVNVLVRDAPGNGHSDSASYISRKSVSSMHSVRSILIGEKSSKNITKKNSGYYPDVDTEKFVRFGTTVTRTISDRSHSTTTRDSEVEMS